MEEAKHKLISFLYSLTFVYGFTLYQNCFITQKRKDSFNCNGSFFDACFQASAGRRLKVALRVFLSRFDKFPNCFSFFLPEVPEADLDERVVSVSLINVKPFYEFFHAFFRSVLFFLRPLTRLPHFDLPAHLVTEV